MDKIASRSAAVISISSAASLTLAIVHETGYFWSINYSLMKLMSLSDYIQSAVLWLPGSFLCLAVGAYWGFGNKVYEREVLAKEEDSKGKTVRIFLARYGSAANIYLMSIVVGAMGLFFERPQANSYVALSIMLMMTICVKGWLSTSATLNEVPEKYKDVIRPSIMVCASVVLFIFWLGVANGVRDTTKTMSNLSVTVPSRQPVVLLRSLSQGNLVMQTKDRKILAVNNNGNVVLSYQLPISTRASHFCIWTGYLCEFGRRHPINDTAP